MVLQKKESVIRVGIAQKIVGHPPQPEQTRYLDCNR